MRSTVASQVVSCLALTCFLLGSSAAPAMAAEPGGDEGASDSPVAPQDEAPTEEADGADDTSDPTTEAGSESDATAQRTVISANRVPERIFLAPRHVTLLDEARRDELGARDVPDMLERETGIVVQRTNRGAGAPIIRGMVGPQNLILVDGIRMNTATYRTGPNQYLALVDPQLLRGVEVVRGPSSVVYGNGALGGAMHILLAEPLLLGGEFAHAGLAQLRFASADSAPGATVRWTGTVGDVGWLIGANFDIHHQLRTGEGAKVPASDYAQAGWLAKLIWAPRTDLVVRAGYLGGATRAAGRTDKLGLGEVRRYDNDEHLAWSRIDWSPTVSWLERVGLRLSWHRQDEAVLRHNCVQDGGLVRDAARCADAHPDELEKKRLNEDLTDAIAVELDAHFTLWDDRIDLTTGLEIQHDVVGSRREDAKASSGWAWAPKDRGNFSDGSTYLGVGLFANASARLFEIGDTFAMHANGGLRFSHFQAHAPDVPDLGDVDYDFQGVVGSVGLQAVIPEMLSVYAAFMQGFRAANLQESTVLGNTGSKFEIPNPDLRPERSDTLEFGARFERPWLGASVTFFHTWLTDFIDEEAATLDGQSEIDGTPVVRRVNAASGTALGLEADVRVSLSSFHLNAGLSWMQLDHTDGDGETTPGRRIPPVQGTVTLRYQRPESSAYAEIGVLWAAAQRRLHPSDHKDHRICQTGAYSGVLQDDCSGTDGYVTLTLAGGLPLHDHVRLDASVSNLLDKRYRRHGSGYDSPGIDVRAALTASY